MKLEAQNPKPIQEDVLVLNGLATLRGNDLKRLAAEPRIGFDIAMKEGVGGSG